MDKETLKTKKVNFLLDTDTIAFFANIKEQTGLTQSKAIAMFVNCYGANFAHDLKKYAKKGETATVSAFIE